MSGSSFGQSEPLWTASVESDAEQPMRGTRQFMHCRCINGTNWPFSSTDTSQMLEKSKPADRARIVCVNCHARKVRCDLSQTGDVCGNCRRRRQTCRRRGRSKHPARTTNSARSPLRSLVAQSLESSENDMEKIQLHPSPSQETTSTTLTPLNPPGYVGELSFMSPLDDDPGQPLPSAMGAFHARFSSKLLNSMNATSLPPKAKVEAFADAYFEHIYSRVPVVDRADLQLEEPSMLISQAICMIGSLLRHPGLRSPLEESEEYYCRAKALLYANYEIDHRNTLKGLCLLIVRNVTPPNVLTLDCSWQWTGMATRLAYQMGLHRESTYSKLTNPGNARRMMWFLFVQDKVQSACYGRPSVIRIAEMDLRPLQLDDFEHQNIQAEIFIEYVKLNMILGQIVDHHGRQTQSQQEEVTIILQSLQQWINNLPIQLHLYDGHDRRPFSRDICQLHINYFVCIIVLCRLFGASLPPTTASATSLVASSCISHLFEEINFRDEINYLMPLSNWFLMVACAPQIQQNAACQGKDKLCTEELNRLVTALRHMHLKWPPAGILLGIIERLVTKSHQGINSTGHVSNCSPDPDYIGETWFRLLSHSDLRGLFPFPSLLSPRIQNLNVEREAVDSMALGRMADLGDDDLDWIFNEYQHGYMEAPLF